MKRIALWGLFLLMIWALYQQRLSGPGMYWGQSRIPAKTSQLKIGMGHDLEPVYSIQLNEPREFDFRTKEKIFDIRKEAVKACAELVEGEYFLSQDVFGDIEDELPWWGLEGQFCRGGRV